MRPPLPVPVGGITAVAITSIAGLTALLSLGAAVAAEPPPSVDAPDLAKGPYSAMRMTFKKTILKINVADIEVRFDKPTQARLAEIARAGGDAAALIPKLAEAAIAAPRAVVQMRMNREVSLDRWMGVVRDNVGEARKAGLISRELADQVSQGLPQWFQPLKERGYQKGDRIVYSMTPDGLRTVVVGQDGQTLLDRSDREKGLRQVVLASYFAPGSEFREPLIKSLLAGN